MFILSPAGGKRPAASNSNSNSKQQAIVIVSLPQAITCRLPQQQVASSATTVFIYIYCLLELNMLCDYLGEVDLPFHVAPIGWGASRRPPPPPPPPHVTPIGWGAGSRLSALRARNRRAIQGQGEACVRIPSQITRETLRQRRAHARGNLYAATRADYTRDASAAPLLEPLHDS